jgi:hypothetical protein
MKRLLVVGSMVLGLVGGGAARGDESLTMKKVDEVVEQNDRAVQACGRANLRKGETLAVMVLLTIDGDGHVADAFAPTHTATSVCIERVARRLQFPAAGDTTQITYPFLVTRR